MAAVLTVIVPIEKAQVARFRGWEKGRCNAYTQTLSLRFANVEDAVFLGRTIPYVWVVESAYR